MKERGEYTIIRILHGIIISFLNIDFVCKAEESYRTAYNTSMASLPANSPIRLGLALNYSVFHYEIANKPEDACTLAKAVSNY